MDIGKFATRVLLQYANENGIHPRDTTDLSPLEKWLIIKLKNTTTEAEKTMQELKEFAYQVCPLHREDDLVEIVNKIKI